MVERTQQAAPPSDQRPAIGPEDPRAARYLPDYEARMAQAGVRTDTNAQARAAAKDKFEQAHAAFENALEKYNTAAAELDMARAEQLRASDAYTRFGNPTTGVQLTPAENLSPGEDTMLMVFPTFVTLQVNSKRGDGSMTGTRSATFPEGIQEVPVSLQNHPYLIAHNVFPYSGPLIEPAAQETAPETDTKVA